MEAFSTLGRGKVNASFKLYQANPPKAIGYRYPLSGYRTRVYPGREYMYLHPC